MSNSYSKFSKSDNTIIKGKDIDNKTVLQQLVKFKLKNNEIFLLARVQ